jgi:hypothetical protein
MKVNITATPITNKFTSVIIKQVEIQFCNGRRILKCVKSNIHPLHLK